MKALFAIIAVGLFVGFLAPVVLKLGEVALWAVVLAGALMMLVDLWQSLGYAKRRGTMRSAK